MKWKWKMNHQHMLQLMLICHKIRKKSVLDMCRWEIITAILSSSNSEGHKTPSAPTWYESLVGFNICDASSRQDKERGTLFCAILSFLSSNTFLVYGYLHIWAWSKRGKPLKVKKNWFPSALIRGMGMCSHVLWSVRCTFGALNPVR